MRSYPFDILRLIQICRANGVRRAGVFGSYARGDATTDSDIDLLVEFVNPVSLLRVAHLQIELAETLGRKIDLTTEAGLSSHIRNQVLQEIDWLFDDLNQ